MEVRVKIDPVPEGLNGRNDAGRIAFGPGSMKSRTGRPSIHVEQKALEILRFGVVDVDRVVERLPVTLEDADAPAGLGRGLEHDLPE
jgi:hypothetical protein